MKSEKQIKIILTGGHAATTAISVVEEIKRRKLAWDLVWIGPRRAIEGKRIATSSSEVLPKFGVNHYSLVAGRFQKKWSRWTIPSLLKIPLGFIHALYLLVKIRPRVILSFGGYAAFPVVVIGWLLGIPVILHAQTVVIGRANLASVFFAKRVAISREESAKLLPKEKVVLTGNPVMSSIIKVRKKTKMASPSTIYITGGSRGSQNINKIVDKILETLLNDYLVIHQTGEIDYQYFRKRKEKLPRDLKSRYDVHGFVDPRHIYRIFEKADMIISRAGANTISEIAITKRPALLIPHPFVNIDEQIRNASEANKDGIALVLSQDRLSPSSLLEKIGELRSSWDKMTQRKENKFSKLDSRAAGKIVSLVEEILV